MEEGVYGNGRPVVKSRLCGGCYSVRMVRFEPLLVIFLFLLLAVYAILSHLSTTELSPAERENLELTQKICDNRTACGLHQPWPKIIHQTWKDKNVPQHFKEYMKTCQDLNPSYRYMFWTDDDIQQLIATHYSWFKNIYDSYPYKIQKVDSGRLFIMHHFGGVYLDIDIKCKVPLEKIREKADRDRAEPADIILARTDPIGITNNILMGKAKHPFYNFLVHRLPATAGPRFTPHWTVMLSAGPLFLYRSFLIYPCKSHVHLVSTADHSNVYFHHLQARTWHSWDGPFIYWFDYHGRAILQAAGLLLLFVFIINMFVRFRRVFTNYLKDTHKQCREK